jgi:hypothetical protein
LKSEIKKKNLKKKTSLLEGEIEKKNIQLKNDQEK